MDRRQFVIGTAAASLLPGAARAQEMFPSRPVTILNAFPPGGRNELVTRPAASALEAVFKQPVVVETKAGAAGSVGAQVASTAKPDGYTLAMGVPSALAVNQYIYKNLPYDTLRDFTPITQSTAITYVMVVNPSLPVKTVQELVAYARARPGQLNYGSAGVGNLMHLSAELFSQETGVKMVHIPNKGETPAVLDAISGQGHGQPPLLHGQPEPVPLGPQPLPQALCAL